MSLSSSCLFHYTNSLEIIMKIIVNGFSPSYCKEADVAIPMVSFCDIPLTNAIRYMDYGDYAIGMNKTWVRNNGLNPVNYMQLSSTLDSRFTENIENILSLNNRLEEINDSNLKEDLLNKCDLIMNAIVELHCYQKPYEGRNDKLDKNNYRFYNEREWRYIPPFEEEKVQFSMSHGDYENYKKDNPEKPHLKHIKLPMKADDIDYLIVKENKDILPLIEFLENLENIGSSKKIKLLTTRILTKKQIQIDF